MQSRYTINVAQAGLYNNIWRHFFRVELEGTTESDAKVVFNELRARFPESERFEVTISYWDCSGRDVTKQFT